MANSDQAIKAPRRVMTFYGLMAVTLMKMMVMMMTMLMMMMMVVMVLGQMITLTLTMTMMITVVMLDIAAVILSSFIADSNCHLPLQLRIWAKSCPARKSSV